MDRLLSVLLLKALLLFQIGVAQGQPALVFPQFVSGESDGIQNRTRVILRNNSDLPASGRLVFRDKDGLLTKISIDEQLVDSWPYLLEAWGTHDLVTDGTGKLASGVIEVIAETGEAEKLEGTVIFEVLGYSVSVPASPLGPAGQIYVSLNPDEQSGIAIYNPDAASKSVLDLVLLDNHGRQTATRQLVYRFINTFTIVMIDGILVSEPEWPQLQNVQDCS